MENPAEVLSECAEKFATPDYIMEPGIFAQLKRYLLTTLKYPYIHASLFV